MIQIGDIISFEKQQKRKQKREKSAKTTEYYAYNENINSFLSHMASRVTKILGRPGIENLIENEKEDRKKFEERYRDMLVAPISNIDKIQYFAGIMLNILPSVFHGERKDRFNAYMDFSEFYLSEFDTAYSQYHSTNQQYKKEYPFRFIHLESDALEKELQDCLEQLVSLASAKNSRKKAEIIMWQACRLFELYHNMVNLFQEKDGEWEKNEENHKK